MLIIEKIIFNFTLTTLFSIFRNFYEVYCDFKFFNNSMLVNTNDYFYTILLYFL